MASKTITLPNLTSPTIGTQEQRDAANKTIDKINKGLAEGITGLTDNKGKKIKEKVLFTDKGAKGAKTGKSYTKPPAPVAPVEPVVISDTKIRNKKIPEIKSKIDKYAETGQYYDANGNTHNADGSLADTNTETVTDTSPEQSQVDELMSSANEDSKFITDTLDQLLKQTDTDTASQIKSIKAQYNAREAQIKEINKREQLATDTALLLGGSSRYTTSSTGISAAQERAGIMELADLDAREISAIAEAKAAQSEKKYKLASEKIDHVEKLRQEKVKKATEIAEKMAEENKKARESMVKSSREYAIADMFRQGITDPSDILDLVNYDESGNQIGDITLKEISDTLAIINPDENLKGASSDYQTYKIMQKNGDIPENWSFFNYKTAVANSTKTGSGDTGFTATEKRKLEQAGLLNAARQDQLDFLYGDEASMVDLAPEDERKLIGAGYSSQDVRDLKKIVNDFGVQEAIDAADSDSKKSALEAVFGIEQKVTRDAIESTVTQKTAIDGLKDTYTEKELLKLARDNGYAQFWSGAEGEVEDFLNSEDAQRLYVDLLVEQYRGAGMYQD